ncbi:hypothetical protein [Agromyces cerinus]|uniref:Cytochrome P450 n=1 Tax=Agromyces cerinus subsp. cerinus TaxID=232089 RepID=A0A1N6E796_9MICO|nr:hypothetical protein [Agromyces cerinus]SIN78797.1 hypothetical protein SAMN05443544_1161 [Agromyces cerinus subsp. cerinus]
MIDIIERAAVERILVDPASRVPEASVAARDSASPLTVFRAEVSRFVNGAEHDARRVRLDALLDGLDPNALAAAAVRHALAGTPAGRIPVTVLAEALGFTEASALPTLVATVASAYPTGETTDPDAADAAVIALFEASGRTDPDERALRVQLLVQAYAATATLVERALALARSQDGAVSTRTLLESVLRDDSPVPVTRRLVPAERGGETLVVLHLDGADCEAAADRPARILAFGAGPRACPAPHHALAIAAAIVDTLRADADRDEETVRHADTR